MKGEHIEINQANYEAAKTLKGYLENRIIQSETPYLMSIGGESGTGKTTTAFALAELLNDSNLKTIVLSLDDYFKLPPLSNDAKRKQDSTWLGPYKEINFAAINQNVKDILNGDKTITKPQVDYHQNKIQSISIDLNDVKVIIFEGTYVSLIKDLQTKVFVLGGPEETLENRKKRNRGIETRDPFVENILQTEHKIIAGHQYLADYIINLEYRVIKV